MQKNIALSMKDHYLNYYHTYDGGRLEELDVKKHGYDFMGHIKFLFDKTGSYLTITGDYGEAVFCWASSKNTLENIRDYSQDLGYFASKCLATSRPTYEYDDEKARQDIKEWLDECDVNPNDWGDLLSNSELYEFNNPDELVDRLVECVDPYRGFDLRITETFDGENNDLKEALEYIDDYWEESAEFWGKKISDSLQVWSHALDLGMKWKRQQESEE